MVEAGADEAAAVRVRIVGSRALRTFKSPWP
jgi:CYTH domain-containing protein